MYLNYYELQMIDLQSHINALRHKGYTYIIVLGDSI